MNIYQRSEGKDQGGKDGIAMNISKIRGQRSKRKRRNTHEYISKIREQRLKRKRRNSHEIKLIIQDQRAKVREKK